MVILPHTSHPTKEPAIFTRYFNRIGSGGSTNTHNSLPSLTVSSPIKKISDSPSLKARKWLSNSLTRLFGPLQNKRANQDSVSSTDRFSMRVISGKDEFCWQEAIDHSLSQLRYLAALERLPQDLADLKFLNLSYTNFVRKNKQWDPCFCFQDQKRCQLYKLDPDCWTTFSWQSAHISQTRTCTKFCSIVVDFYWIAVFSWLIR